MLTTPEGGKTENVGVIWHSGAGGGGGVGQGPQLVVTTWLEIGGWHSTSPHRPMHRSCPHAGMPPAGGGVGEAPGTPVATTRSRGVKRPVPHRDSVAVRMTWYVPGV